MERWDLLPRDVVGMVRSRAGVRERDAMLLVCKSWRAACQARAYLRLPAYYFRTWFLLAATYPTHRARGIAFDGDDRGQCPSSVPGVTLHEQPWPSKLRLSTLCQLLYFRPAASDPSATRLRKLRVHELGVQQPAGGFSAKPPSCACALPVLRWLHGLERLTLAGPMRAEEARSLLRELPARTLRSLKIGVALDPGVVLLDLPPGLTRLSLALADRHDDSKLAIAGPSLLDLSLRTWRPQQWLIVERLPITLTRLCICAVECIPTLRERFAELTDLRSLDLHATHLSGAPIDAVGALRHLTLRGDAHYYPISLDRTVEYAPSWTQLLTLRLDYYHTMFLPPGGQLGARDIQAPRTHETTVRLVAAVAAVVPDAIVQAGPCVARARDFVRLFGPRNGSHVADVAQQ